MSKRRRTFGIDLPDEIKEGVVPPHVRASAGRRGPMASAISENAEALQARRSTADAIREENDRLAHEYVAQQEAGLVVRQLPLDAVTATLLVRDRLLRDEDLELDDLVTSISDIGLSNPIRVVARPGGETFELVQGYRRLAAYKKLREGGSGWEAIPALVVAEGVDIGGLYRRMVDENVVRKDLSFAEMAHIARVYADDPATDADSLKKAIGALFQSAPYSKRSYIRSFAYLMEVLGKQLMFATEIPRKLGVDLVRELKGDPELIARLADALKAAPHRDVDEEMRILRDVIRREDASDDIGPEEALVPDGRGAKPEKGDQAAKTKTTFHIKSSAGQVKCTAAEGRLEIKVNRDFSAIDRQRLEDAVAALIEGLQ